MMSNMTFADKVRASMAEADEKRFAKMVVRAQKYNRGIVTTYRTADLEWFLTHGYELITTISRPGLSQFVLRPIAST